VRKIPVRDRSPRGGPGNSGAPDTAGGPGDTGIDGFSMFPYTDRHRWWYPALIKIMMMSALAALLYGKPVKVQRHWWNGNRSPRGPPRCVHP
jgi:hypothetical protein